MQQSIPRSAEHPPSWVVTLNAALEKSASSYAAAYVILDLGLTFVLLVIFIILRFPVDADFALAFAISKGIGKGPRLALDAAAAGALARFYPALAAVRVSLLLDAAGRSLRTLNPFTLVKAKMMVSQSTPSLPELPPPSPAAAALPDAPIRSSRFARAATEVRRLTDRYGLAYVAAKNLLGPLGVLIIYAGLQARGVDWRSPPFLASPHSCVPTHRRAGALRTRSSAEARAPSPVSPCHNALPLLLAPCPV